MREAMRRPRNMAIRDLLSNELFTEAALEFVGSTDAGTIKEGVVLDKG